MTKANGRGGREFAAKVPAALLTARIGSPVRYTTEVADAILTRLANGESLKAICRDAGMPSVVTVRQWVIDDREGFADLYERARMLCCYAIADELLEIADDSSGDMTVDEDGRIVVNHENINRSRLRADTRTWLLSKLLPKQFGDKVEQQITGAGGAPLTAPIFNIAFVTPQRKEDGGT